MHYVKSFVIRTLALQPWSVVPSKSTTDQGFSFHLIAEMKRFNVRSLNVLIRIMHVILTWYFLARINFSDF